MRYGLLLLLQLLSQGCRHAAVSQSKQVTYKPVQIGDLHYQIQGEYLIRSSCQELNQGSSPCLDDVKKVYYQGFQVVFSRDTEESLSLNERLNVLNFIEGQERELVGANNANQIRSSFDRLNKMPVDGTIHIADGYRHTCAISVNGLTYCWGFGCLGALGIGTECTVPVPIKHTKGVYSSLALGNDSSCGIGIDGTGYCWGYSFNGESGTGIEDNILPSPYKISGGQQFLKISHGEFNVCGIDINHNAYCWGGRNEKGNLGTGIEGKVHSVPTPVQGGLLFKQISTDSSHTCGIDLNGKGYCWGTNYKGNLGTGDKSPHKTPTPVLSNEIFSSIHTAEDLTCALNHEGNTFCWGALGSYGGIEDPTNQDHDLSFRNIAIASRGGLALTTEGQLYSFRPFSNSDNRTSKITKFLDDYVFSAIAAFNCGIEYDVAYCWGSNSDSAVPVKMPKQKF